MARKQKKKKKKMMKEKDEMNVSKVDTLATINRYFDKEERQKKYPSLSW